MLQGDRLLSRLDQLRGRSRTELVRACGYCTRSEDGREHLHFTDFYEAVLEAKGVHLPGQSGRWRASRNAQGRQLSFNTQVHYNGNLMVGRAYTQKLQLKPGDQFRIHLHEGEIRLTPLEPCTPPQPSADRGDDATG